MDFNFPDVGEGIHEGTIVKWHVKVGDSVKRDQVLCDVETDKAIVEIPSPNEGVIDELFHKEGDVVHVGEVLVRYHTEEKTQTAPKNEAKSGGAGAVGAIKDAEDLGENKGPLFDQLANRQKDLGQTAAAATQVLPSLRKLATDLGVDLLGLTGTGDGGRITENDIRSAAVGSNSASSSENTDDVTIEELTVLRKATAKHLQKGLGKIIPVTSTHLVDITDLATYRKSLNEKLAASGVKLSFLPFIFKALFNSLKEFPRFNAQWEESKEVLQLYKHVNLGVAVDAPDGLFVPVIKRAELLNLQELAKEILRVAEGVKAKTLPPAELSGSSITVTNYGTVGTYLSTPVINYPNTAILGIGALQSTVKIIDGQVVERQILPLSVTFDHRFIDGADCARFLNLIAESLMTKSVFEAWT